MMDLKRPKAEKYFRKMTLNKKCKLVNEGVKKMYDGLFFLTNLFGAMNTRPSNSGDRIDKKVCNAKPGECRHNHKFYSLGMRDEKSWSLPIADETCDIKCSYLISIDKINI